jgi:hypothetical protein
MKQKDFYNSTAWKYCSRYVLLYYSRDGLVQCSTCGKWYQLPNKLIQCGHLHKSDSNRSVSFNFYNLAPQCYKDNKFFSGKPDVMRDWLIRKHGEDSIIRLDYEKNIYLKLDDYQMAVYKEHYKQLFNELVKTKSNPWK